ncbi:MAG: FeoA family protein [Actinomycetota bacterium]
MRTDVHPRRTPRHRPEAAGGSTLDHVAPGRKVRIVGVVGGTHLMHRLAALGIVPGAEVTVVRGHSPLLVSLGGARVAMGRQAARSILVAEAAP